MPSLSTGTVRTGGVTLVELRVTTTAPHRVRLAIRCDGPVWPPRGPDGRATWETDAVTLDVADGETGAGFATPAPPAAVDVELSATDPLDDALPAGIDAWLEAVERRIRTAERVADAEGLAAATDVVAAVGGLEAVERLAAELARDRRLMARFSFAPPALRRRADAVELPVGALAAVAQSRSS